MSAELTDAHIEAQSRLRQRASQAMIAAWMALPSYDETDVPAFLRSAVPITTAAQRASVAVTNAYLARRLVRRPTPLNTDDVLAHIRNGTSSEEVYRRPFVDVWTMLKKGTAWDDAVAAGAERAASSAAMDIQLAMRATVTEVARLDPTIVGYRRVPDPGACTLCLMASTQRYHSEDLMPIHNHCGCSVDVITGHGDPGRVIDKDLLDELKASGEAGRLSLQQGASRAAKRAEASRLRAASAKGPESRARWSARADQQDALARDYRARAAAKDSEPVAVAMHGELGPLLVNSTDHFTRL